MWIDLALVVGMVGCLMGSVEADFRSRRRQALGLFWLGILLGVGLLVHAKGV